MCVAVDGSEGLIQVNGSMELQCPSFFFLFELTEYTNGHRYLSPPFFLSLFFSFLLFLLSPLLLPLSLFSPLPTRCYCCGRLICPSPLCSAPLLWQPSSSLPVLTQLFRPPLHRLKAKHCQLHFSHLKAR